VIGVSENRNKMIAERETKMTTISHSLKDLAKLIITDRWTITVLLTLINKFVLNLNN